MLFQKSLVPTSEDPEGASLAWASHSSWYPDFTEQAPVLHLGQATQSSWVVAHTGLYNAGKSYACDDDDDLIDDEAEVDEVDKADDDDDEAEDEDEDEVEDNGDEFSICR
ncbi:uncharacterized protein LOC142640696 [Castanea sativa]|uniref:uncharacterized protein LOC142640696 n=1 Tax=Castanea sativa TaxID=21020 RepID=UPI003F6500B7